MTAGDWMVLGGVAALGAAFGYVVAVLRYAEPAIDAAMLEADLARWKARGAKEEARAERLAEENHEYALRIDAALAALTIDDTPAVPPEAG
jgi:hypothetical protein